MVSEDLKSNINQLAAQYLKDNASLQSYKTYLEEGKSLLVQKFKQETNIVELIHGRSSIIDHLLIHLWNYHLNEFQSQLTLVAVGGYGRGELHPNSDIDLLILCPSGLDGFESQIQDFIASLWDTGLEIGHSVRTPKECQSQAKNDISIATSLMESRIISGDNVLFEHLVSLTASDTIWPGKEFFAAKYQEQRNRHLKFQKTSYSLEPNMKKSPGGLRDIQLVAWVAKRQFSVNSMGELVKLGFLTTTEFNTLEKCEIFLWEVRFALHTVAGRAEDRLLFDHQKPVAELLGYSDGEHLTDVEQFMKQYYRVVKTIREHNDMLLQHFSETILEDVKAHQIKKLDEHFQIHGEQIEIIHDKVFINDPACLLRLFLHLADHPELKGVRAPTLRRIIIDRELINNDEFRSKETNKQLFLELFRHPNGIGKPFVLMKRYGVLKAYLPAYARILGQMQYDLFHIYTVDEHTLFLMDNLAKFSEDDCKKSLPLCADVMTKIKKRELLYLGALFHDIGKGQGGNHSEIGAVEALKFCQFHNLSEEDTSLVSWLVKQHLLMSKTAQRMDITDPEVINNFANQMGNIDRLNNLYLLTVADIRATNPQLWNNWKDSLLQNLYLSTSKALARGLENPKNTKEAIQETKTRLLQRLNKKRITSSMVENLWARFKDDYFIRNSEGRIEWQSTEIIYHDKSGPLIAMYRHPDSGATEIFVYMKKHPNYFSLITTLLYEKNLSIQDASLHSTHDGYILGSFVIQETDGQPISSERRIQSVKKLLSKSLKNPDGQFKHLKRRIPYKYSYFDVKTEIKFTRSENGNRSLLKLVALDKPGLLARIGLAFRKMNIELHSAKVVTLGEKVEDIFAINNAKELPLELEEQQELRQLLQQYIESEHPEQLD